MLQTTALTLLLTVAPFNATPEVPDSDLGSRIEAYVQPFVADGHLSGTLLVARSGDILFEKSWGMANYELGVPNTASTKFCVASVTKPMTIVLTVQLIAEGKLGLQDKLEKYIDGFPKGDVITVDHLLNHRAGIPHRVTSAQEETEPRSAADMVELAKKKGLSFEPGEKSSYSSGGYAVLARVLEIVSGKSFAELLDERLFGPLRMEHSAHVSHRTVLPLRAPSYLPTANGVMNAPLKDLSFLVGAGSVYSTPRDLHRLLHGLIEGRLGSAAKMALWRTNGVRWNGITNGYRAFVDYDAETEIEVIFAGNLQTGAPDRIRKAVPRMLQGEDVEVPPRLALRRVEIPPATFRRYEGVYETRNGTAFDLRIVEGQIMAGTRLLVPIGEARFYCVQDYCDVVIVSADDGSIQSLDWLGEDGVYSCRRIGDRRVAAP